MRIDEKDFKCENSAFNPSNLKIGKYVQPPKFVSTEMGNVGLAIFLQQCSKYTYENLIEIKWNLMPAKIPPSSKRASNMKNVIKNCLFDLILIFSIQILEKSH